MESVHTVCMYRSDSHGYCLHVSFTVSWILIACIVHSRMDALCMYRSQSHGCFVHVSFTVAWMLCACIIHSRMDVVCMYRSQSHGCFVHVSFTVAWMLLECIDLFASRDQRCSCHSCALRGHLEMRRWTSIHRNLSKENQPRHYSSEWNKFQQSLKSCLTMQAITLEKRKRKSTWTTRKGNCCFLRYQSCKTNVA